MIKEIQLAEMPCFGDGAVLSNLATVNYIFGPNGSGKTTVSHHLAAYDSAGGSTVSWDRRESTIKVYNRNYVRNAFTNADGEEPGVFLLGEDSSETFKHIGELEEERGEISGKLERLKKNLEEHKGALEEKRSILGEKVWRSRKVIPQVLKEQMKGLNGSKAQCLEKVLEAAKAHATCGEENFDDLEAKAVTAFDNTMVEATLLPVPPEPCWDQEDLQAVLSTPIVGSADVPLAALIDRLGISDWVRDGLKISQEKDLQEVCPFCQQSTPKNLADDLARIFDVGYQERQDEVAEFHQFLSGAAEEVKDYGTANVTRLGELVGTREVEQVFRELELAHKGLLNSIQQKMDKPSADIRVDSIADEYSRLKELVATANKKIRETNDIIADRRRQQRAIVDAAWREFARGQLSELVDAFIKDSEDCRKAIGGIEGRIRKKNEQLCEADKELRQLRADATSSDRAIQGINDLLRASQFHSFKLAPSKTKADGYRIIRNDGQAADVDTLSEGERTFITFLYFYHSLSAVKQDGESEKVVAVIDDPVSSLDGDIMFVVSALMRRLIDQVKKGEHERVGQVLMLTHNTRFHNEVCYRHQGESSPEIKFYRIRKFSPEPNVLEDCGPRNPIRTAYQELWDEVAAAASLPDRATPWLPNVLRRILESYFGTLGGIGNLYDIGDELGVDEKIVHDALIAWLHGGSHTIVDAEVYAQHSTTNKRWLQAFFRIFEKCAGGVHGGHKEMMMREACKHRKRLEAPA